ncbi:hypothetical protein N8478_01405 [bacterium]|nr:hypothetical protein [bacterium]
MSFSQNNYELFLKQGFLIFEDTSLLTKLKSYSFDWVDDLFNFSPPKDLSFLHKHIQNEKSYSLDLCQSNRHRSNAKLVYEIIEDLSLASYFSAFYPGGWQIWDEGFGSLGLRLVRPNSNDGYNWSKKSWGPASSVLSLSICIFSTDKNSSLNIIPSSHLFTDLPVIKENSIHCKDELRLDLGLFNTSASVAPCGIPGSAILMHPCLLHTEKNFSNSSTRLSLEFRICAL